VRLVVLGLTLSSSWGNGHATTYRALLKAFFARGHQVLFLERAVPWYAGAHRDLADPDYCDLRFYDSLDSLRDHAPAIRAADAVMVGSYVPDGVAVGQFVQETAGGVTAFYDIDTPVTLARLEAGERDYLSAEQIPAYDVYFSFTGGPILRALVQRFGARRACPLYCSADPALYRWLSVPVRWDLSYLGTYSADRQPMLERLLIEPARRAPHLRFAVAGAQYPPDLDWPANVERIAHVAPADHARFYAASRMTLNVTRADMVRAGYSPSVRLFEAAACATPVLSDPWPGVESFFEPEREIVLAQTTEAALAAITRTAAELGAQGLAARRRMMAGHTAAHRAETLERALRAAGALEQSHYEWNTVANT
jgi:spore maturation protein CgeB